MRRVLMLLALLVAAAGCGQKPPPAGKGVTIGLLAAPASFSPIKARELADQQIQAALFRGFVLYDAAGRMVPAWTSVLPSRKDRTFRSLGPQLAEYQFHLRPNAQWSDGIPLLPDDFLFAYRMAVHPLIRKGHDYWTKSLRKLEVGSDGTVTVVVERSPTLDTLDLFPLPRHVLEVVGLASPTLFEGHAFHDRPISDGPYAYESGTPADVRLQLNPRYQPKPGILEVLRFVSRDDALAGLEKGEVDLVPDVPAEKAVSWTPPEGVKLITVPSPRLTLLAFNTRHAALRHEAVRRALAGAIARGPLAKSVGAVPTDSWLQPTHAAYQPACKIYAGDAAAAAKALEKSGWKADPQGRLARATTTAPVTILVPGGREAAGDAVKDAWAKLGVKAALDVRSGRAYAEALAQRRFAAAIQELEIFPWTQPAAYFGAAAIPTSRNGYRGSNVSGWSTPEHEALLAAIAASPAPAGATSALKSEQELMAREVAVLPLYFHPQVTAVRSTVEGVSPRGWGAITWNVETWKVR